MSIERPRRPARRENRSTRSLPAICAALGLAAMAGSQDPLPVLEATRPVVSIREGATLRSDAWRLAPEASPDVYEVELKDGQPLEVTFISDVGSLSFVVEEGGQHDFIIQHGADRCLTRIVGVRAIPAAVFDAGYRAAHDGRISVEVPEVYELVNVALAMTPTGLADRNLFYQDSEYYASVRKWFDPHKDHPGLAALGAALVQRPGLHASLKMNGYAFEFDGNGRIVQSRVYDRTAFSGERRNTLLEFIEGLQRFADATRFRAFYEQSRPTYAGQIAFYRDEAGLDEMRAWLARGFPGSAGYNSIKVIFSPLVGSHQSATWVESNGFRELLAHVNYPYPEQMERRTGGIALSKKALTLLRGSFAFTEINHGYINPEADRHAERLARALSRREHWVDPNRARDYYPGISAFNEYMNWGLVSLRAADVLPEQEAQRLIGIVDGMMAGRRGFLQFAAFDAFLVDLYRRRDPGQSLADLYPRIIAWFETRDAKAPDPASPPR